MERTDQFIQLKLNTFQSNQLNYLSLNELIIIELGNDPPEVKRSQEKGTILGAEPAILETKKKTSK